MKKVYLVLGPSGSGKDTQAEKLSAKEGGLKVVSTGKIFRRLEEDEDDLGLEAAEYTSKGEWVPDELTLKVLKRFLKSEDFENGLILTGFPRTRRQAEEFEKLLQELDLHLENVIHLDTSREEIFERVKHRVEEDRNSGEERDDDKKSLLEKRLDEYEETIGPILKFYKNKDLLIRVNNDQEIEEVFSEIEERL